MQYAEAMGVRMGGVNGDIEYFAIDSAGPADGGGEGGREDTS